MTARPTTRPFVCVLLVLSFFASMAAIAAPAAECERATEMRAVAAASSTVLMSRAGAPNDHARQRPSGPSCFTLVRLHDSASDPGRLSATVEGCYPASISNAEPRTGRSPPAAIS
jgi:hypothetical protein